MTSGTGTLAAFDAAYDGVTRLEAVRDRLDAGIEVLAGGQRVHGRDPPPGVPARDLRDHRVRSCGRDRGLALADRVHDRVLPRDYQVEHHLFPSMARDNLSRAQPVVQAFSREQGLTYTQTSLPASYAIVARHLNHVGFAVCDPFTCHFINIHRR